jgi:lipid A 3-O-deacylase
MLLCHMHTPTLIFLSTLCLLSGTLMASQESPWQLIGQWDNDLLTGTDDGYTNGARIALTRELSTNSAQHNFLQNTLRQLTGSDRGDSLSDFRFPDSGPLNFQYGIGLSQLMFTPENPNTAKPPAGERPYAGWLGLEFSLQASASDSASTATLSVGTTGRLSYAQDIQKWIHQNVSDSPVFQGWDTQAPAELTINLHFDHKQRLTFLDRTNDWPLEVDGCYEWGAALGNFGTNAYIGAIVRVGYNLPASYATPRVQLGSFTETIFEKERAKNKNLSLYTYAGLRGYAVLHDITLDGPLFRDWDESVDSTPWVGELSLGVAARYQQIEVSLSHTLRSDEFEDPLNRSRYGSVLLRIGVSY